LTTLSNQPSRHPSNRSLPRWSPDGRKILVELGRRPSIVNRELREEAQIGPQDTWVTYPDWSPDGKRVTYAYRGLHGDQKEPHWGIYSSAPDGSDTKLMSASGWRGQWSPDSQKVAYHLVKKDAPTRISVMDQNGDNETILAAEDRPGQMAWSPDSKTLVFESWSGEGGQLYQVDLQSKEKSRLIPGSHGSDKSAQFSPDGSKILFERFHSEGRRTELRVLDRESGAETPFASPNRSNHDGAWSPDGNWVVFTSNTKEGNFDLYMTDAQGSNLRQITAMKGDEFAPAWSPDGSSIAFYHFDRDAEDGAQKSVRVFNFHPGATDVKNNQTATSR
jgi:Tol biopolymer transport system component